jgi:hypothetical protein
VQTEEEESQEPVFWILVVSLGLAFAVQPTIPQTSAFNYRGNLNSGGVPANGSYDFEFALFDSVSGGTQVGSTITRNSHGNERDIQP